MAPIQSSKRFKPGDADKDQRKKLEYSSQNQDGRNRLHESKKIMKKSASFKLSDVGSSYLMKATKKTPKSVDISDIDALISIPNYMKHTRSSGAKKDDKQARAVVDGVQITNLDSSRGSLAKMPSLKLATKNWSFKHVVDTGKKKKNRADGVSCSDNHVRKETCSSLLKDSKFPSHVMIECSGASSMEVCTYKYCSLNRHRPANAQPFKSFVSDKRRSLKKQKSLKLKDDPSRQVPFPGKDEIKQEFVQRVEAESDEELYKTIWEAYEKEIQQLEYIEAQLGEEDFDSILENSFKGSVTVSDDFADICIEDKLEGCCEEDECKNKYKNSKETFSSYMEDLVDKEMVFPDDETTAVCTEKEENAEDEGDREIPELDENVFVCTLANGMSGIKITEGKATGDEDSDIEKDFNPQEPCYLPLEQGAKEEQVDLKHQDIDERKNSEEWMVDYALRKTVTKLAPVKRKKVELLVEAFESVAPSET